MKKIAMLSVLLFSILAGGCSQTTQTAANSKTENATDFPVKPIELIVPLAPGSGTDTIARILANGVKKYLPNNQTVVVENKPGGAATIGATEVFNAKPDGYKIGIVPTASISIQPHYGKTPYTHDSFQPILRATSDPLLFVVKSDAPWKTFEEWLDYVKQNPGKFTYGTAGVGSTPHLVMEMINSALEIQTKAVPFDGGGQQLTALLGGHVQGALIYPQSAKAQLDSGKIRVLVNVGKSKVESMKDIPLLQDKGLKIGVDVFNGLVAPKGTPEEELKILHDSFKKALEDPEVIAQFKEIGINPAYTGPEDFQHVITEDFHTNGEIMKKVGLIQ